jgi:hypothetical protein
LLENGNEDDHGVGIVGCIYGEKIPLDFNMHSQIYIHST